MKIDVLMMVNMSILYISEVLHLNIIYYNASSHRCSVVNTSANCEMMTEIPSSIDIAKTE